MTNLPSDLIICGFGGLSLVCGIAVALLSFLNKKRFSAICTLYKKKFGSLPAGEIIFNNDFTRHKLALQDYPDIKRALGLSTSSITHRWNQTGVADIEGYATFIEKAAKYVKMMKAAGYVGIALDGMNRLDKIYEACTVGSDCEKTAYTEVGSFSVGLGTGIGASALVSDSVSTTVCSVVLGALTIEAAGAGMLACGVIFTGAVGYAGGEAGGMLGEKAGEVIYEVTK